MNPNVTVIHPTITEEKGYKTRGAAYCRVSSDSADQLNSYMVQMRYYENFLKDSETEMLVNVYADEGITGTRMDKRDEFQRMLKDCQVLWTANMVRNMLRNERYIGDALFQKCYVTETLPHREKPNHGEKPRYYVTGVNPPIVEREVFETAQKILLERHKPYSDNKHFLSGKIKCGECDSTFKHKKRVCGDCWVCRKHDLNADNCPARQIEEMQIDEAFMTLYNKLKRQYTVIFPPLLLQLLELKNKKFSGNQQYMEISKKIAELKEQIHVLTRLKTKGFIDNEKYFLQTAELNAKIEKLNRDQRKQQILMMRMKL